MSPESMRVMRPLWLLTLLGVCGFLVLSITVGEHGFLHLQKLRQEQQALRAEATTLVRSNEELRSRISRLQQDNAFLEKVVREELKFVKKGELVYLFPEAAEAAKE